GWEFWPATVPHTEGARNEDSPQTFAVVLVPRTYFLLSKSYRTTPISHSWLIISCVAPRIKSSIIQRVLCFSDPSTQYPPLLKTTSLRIDIELSWASSAQAYLS